MAKTLATDLKTEIAKTTTRPGHGLLHATSPPACFQIFKQDENAHHPGQARKGAPVKGSPSILKCLDFAITDESGRFTSEGVSV